MKQTLQGWYTAAKLSRHVQQLYKQQQKTLFHKDAQHQMCEKGDTGYIWYNAFVNIGLLPTKRITLGTNPPEIQLLRRFASKSWFFLSCMRTSPTAPFAIQHGHLHVIFPISKDHKCFSLIQMWIEYFGVPWHAVLIHKYISSRNKFSPASYQHLMWPKYSNMPEETSCLKSIHVSNKKVISFIF